jgi:DNA-binding transcriptional LysR family regulator
MDPFRREPLTAFVATNHPLARRGTIQASDLADHGVVVKVRREGESRSEEELLGLAKKGVKLNIVMRWESPESLKEAVRNGTM